MTDKDYIDEAQQEAQLRYGKELTPEELADTFLGHDFEARIHHLKNLKQADEYTVKDAAKRHAYERQLRNMHERLRKVDR